MARNKKDIWFYLSLLGISVFLLVVAVIATNQENLSDKKLIAQAEEGKAEAQLRLADQFYFEDKNYEQAFYWYKKSAEQGYLKAQERIAKIYREGKGVLQSNQEAEKWEIKAFETTKTQVEQGKRDFLFSLAGKYRYGKGTPKDMEKAKQIYAEICEDKNNEFGKKSPYACKQYEKMGI